MELSSPTPRLHGQGTWTLCGRLGREPLLQLAVGGAADVAGPGGDLAAQVGKLEIHRKLIVELG